MSRSRKPGHDLKPWNADQPYWRYNRWTEHGPKDVRQAITRRRRHENRRLLANGAEAQSELEPERRDAPWEWH